MTSKHIAVLTAAFALVAMTALVVPPGQPALARGVAPVFTGILKGVAVGGYDPVAYFTQGTAVEGSSKITAEHSGATWRFASEANRAAFLADPNKFAPQYGGYCAYAVSQGYTAKGDPHAWSIHDGKLYLNYNRAVRTDWEKDKVRFIKLGDGNWPKVLNKP